MDHILNVFRHTVAAIQQHMDHLTRGMEFTDAAVIPRPLRRFAVGGRTALGVDAALTAALNAADLLLRPQRPEQVDKVFCQGAQLFGGGKIIDGVDIFLFGHQIANLKNA